ncbi:TPA: hypothetical protein ACGW3W_002213 [Pseudomonas aeruginosa]
MSSKPYMAISVSLVGECNVPHAGGGRLDVGEAEALIALLGSLGYEQCQAFAENQGQAHLMVAALDKLRGLLATPAPAMDGAA